MTHSASIFPLSALAVCGILLLGKPLPQTTQPPVTASPIAAAGPYANSMTVAPITGTALAPEQMDTAASIFDKNHNFDRNHSASVVTRLEPTRSLLTHPLATQTARISYRVIGAWRDQDAFQNISTHPPTLRTSQCHSACLPGIT